MSGQTRSHERIAGLLAAQHGLITRKQAMACGLSGKAIEYRTRAGGPWQRLLPAVFLTTTGTPTGEQREVAALLYGGPDSVLTGAAALRRHRINIPEPGVIDLLIPASQHRTSTSFVRLHRTHRLPAHCVEGAVRWVLPARAVADMALGMSSLGDVRAVVAKVVQGGQSSVPLLRQELDGGPIQGSALFRHALGEVADGVRSSPEADLRVLVKRAGLPMPVFNPRLYAGKRFIACPDDWWPREGVAAEVDSREWHLSPEDWEKTMRRHEAMGAYGIITLHFTPQRIRREPAGVVSAIREALAAGRARPPLAIRTVRAEG